VGLGVLVAVPVLAAPGLTVPAAAATPDDEAAGEVINVRLLDEETREPVAGAVVRVLQGGEVVGEAETDDTGLAGFDVPEPGEYDVEVDLESLPEEFAGLTLARNPFTTRVDPGTPRTVALRLVTEGEQVEAGGGISWGTTPQLLVTGLRFGLILALAAIGLSLVFGTTGLTNFAHGELVTFGALVTFSLNSVAGLPLLVAAPITLVLAAAFGWLQDSLVWRQLRSRGIGLIAMMIFSIGFAFFLRFLFLYVYGGGIRFYTDFTGQSGLSLGPVVLRPLDLVSMGLSVVVLVAVALTLLYTRIGRATRAVADNPALAATSGIDVDRVIRVVWVAGTVLAALAGILFTVSQGASYLLGFQILLLVFAAVVLGGLGTAFGATLGAVLVGVISDLSTLVIPAELESVGALVVLIIILLVRPQGLLGRRERIG
jgi:branched-chain amino acid transport system permease protein